jgi:uncharacterized protein
MTKLKMFAMEKPLLFSILIMISALVFEIIPIKNAYLLFVNERFASYLGEITVRVVICLFIIIMLKQFGFFKMAGFTSPKHWKDYLAIWPVAILILLNSSSIITGDVTIDVSSPALLGTYILDSFSIGFFEEILVRGMILTVLLYKWGNTRQGIYLSVIGSSVIFGLAHIINLIKNPELVLATFSHILYATFFGVIFAALVLRNKTIWLMIISHSLFDFCGNIKEISVGGGIAASEMVKASTTLSDAVAAVAITFPLFIYGLFLLRKVSPNNMPAAQKNNFIQSEAKI